MRARCSKCFCPSRGASDERRDISLPPSLFLLPSPPLAPGRTGRSVPKGGMKWKKGSFDRSRSLARSLTYSVNFKPAPLPSLAWRNWRSTVDPLKTRSCAYADGRGRRSQLESPAASHPSLPNLACVHPSVEASTTNRADSGEEKEGS